ncbi:MAG: Enoyl-[acyl-carrier-protein] reductase [NADPH] FabL [Chloroflexi bacterium]|nr:Enoyl-[acyl-carrier-protein] reductase [NADPH] FabL [Chloroflexota bacterium]
MPSPKPFQGKTALITGSGRGIGRAIALHFASLGADIVVNFFRNRQPAQETVAEIEKLGQRAHLVKANVGDIDDIDKLISETEDVYGGLDFLISNAGSGFNRPVMEQRPKGWDWTMDINARSLLFLAQKAVPLMEKRGGGAIVSTSSPGSFRVLPEYAVVGASKAALESLTRYLAVELAPRNINANAVSPGIVETEALQHFNTMQDEDILDEVRRQTPAGRICTPHDVAQVVAFLCSPEAEMIRGQVVLVDGGFTLPASGIERPS